MTKKERKIKYSRSILEVSSIVTTALDYKQSGRDLGVLFYTLTDNKWHVVDCTDFITKDFDTEKQAKEYINSLHNKSLGGNKK